MNDSASTLPMDDMDLVNGSSLNQAANVDQGVKGNMIATNKGILRNDSKRYGVVDRRQQRQTNSQAEQRFLLPERDDSDLEHNIGRLCQYLSGSEEEDEEDEPKRNDLHNNHKRSSTNLQRPTGLFTLNSRQRHEKRSVDSGTSSSLVSDENCNCQHQEQQMSTSSNLVADNSPQVIPMQRLVPRDFLNIPPPAQPPPPEESPTSRRPLPPQRTLPPLPDEPVYEEAKPGPPPPLPKPSKEQLQKNQNGSSRNTSGKSSSVVSPIMAGSCHATQPITEESLAKPLYLSQGSQYNDIDWHNYETSILERNDAGSFYIPSGQTTMSSISPSRKSGVEKRNNYLLEPTPSSAPVPILPMRQEPANHRFRPHSMLHPKDKVAKFHGRRDCMACYSWKCMTYSLAATMVFALAVIIYLLYANVTASSAYSSSSSSVPNSPYGSNTQFGYATYSTVIADLPSQGFPSPSLRPLPESFSLGDEVIADLVPREFTQTYFTLQRNSYVQFNVSLDSQTRLAIYGRQTLPASPTQYDFVRVVQGTKFHTRRYDGRIRRDNEFRRLAENLRSTTFVQFLSGGRWHLSILNDDSEIRTIRFSASLADAEKEECKNSCHNKGVCKEGKCYCFDGFTGTYCEETFCPVLCSGNGIFVGGKCHCHHGWKGSDCDVPSNVCEVPNCHGHGQCNNKGECLCDKGYKGQFCDQRECPHENCSGHGVCHNGKCYCDFGYKGTRCDEVYTSEGLCPSSVSKGQCNGRGQLDSGTGLCTCEQGWIGDQCEKRLCHMNCGPHGRCVNDQCQCDDGFTGEKCDRLSCASGCEDNGKCMNGTCRCNEGWNGENCQLAGCPNSCNQRGQCKVVTGLWRCVCPVDFGGDDCSLPLERQCSDNIDNDADGLVDCEDSECCGSASCQNDQYCRTVPDPYQVLIRKPSSPPQASFFQKTHFLLDPDSVQQYPDATLFSESRVAVIRGRVVNSQGGSLMAVRIANAANALYGFTLSRGGGYFDLMVDGGGAVTLQFVRKPFVTHYSTVVVPWNQIIYIGDVVMTTKEESTSGKDTIIDRWSQSCLSIFKEHDIKPFAAPSWKYIRGGASPGASGVIADAAAVQESQRIPGSDVFLTYMSSNAVGRDSTILVYLVPSSPPRNLRLVRLVIDVQGVHFETTLEAKANLSYVYGWDKRNIYKQQVIGVAAATVRVGYVYANCERVFWETMNVKLSGHTGSISEIGGWNLNIHHRYNILDSVLEKGDGRPIYLREELSYLVNTVGTKEQRQITCVPPACNGPTSTAQLYRPMAVAASRDGSVFIGDYNLIRRMTSSNNLWTIFELSIADTAHRYYLAVHPISGDLYISLPLRRQIWKIKTFSPTPDDLASNYQVVIGSGEICSLESECGDGASAEEASLTYPKGIAFDSHGNLYIADDRRIRLVSVSGLTSTLVGSSSDHSWQPLPCSTIFTTAAFRPQWPTSLTFDHNSGTVLFLDTDVIFELTAGGHFVVVRAGAPSHCGHVTNARNETIRPTLLKGAVGIAASSDGRILFTETDRKRTHRVRSVDRYGRVTLLAGAESKCDCHRRHCPCDDESEKAVNGRDAHLHNPSSIAVDQAGNTHIVDEGNFKIRTLKSAVPTFDSRTKLYEIVSPDSQEVYYFNRFGQHVATKDSLTDRFLYNFTYHLDTSYGKLSHVIGAGGHKIYVIRKSASKIHIENTNGLKSVAHISQFDQMLEKFVSPTGAETQFGYEGNTGLLTKKVDSSTRAWFYKYDSHGRLVKAVLPTGDVLQLKYTLFKDQVLVDVKSGEGMNWNLAVSESEMKIRGDPRDRSMFMLGDFVYHISTPDGVSVQYDGTGRHPPDAGQATTVFRKKVSLPSTLDPPRPPKTMKVEWRYYQRQSGRNHKRVAQVNGVNVLTVEYDREKNVDVVMNQNNDRVLSIYYNAAGFVTQWAPASPNVGVMNITFDQLGRLISHNWVSIGRTYSYDRVGRLIETGDSSDAFKRTKKFKYSGENNLPSIVETPSGSRYELQYDSSGHLRSITSPSGHLRRYSQQSVFGSMNYLVYSHPNSKPHILSKRLDGLHSAVYFGDGSKRTAYIYDTSSRLSRTIYDEMEVTLKYDPVTGLLSSRKWIDKDDTTRLEFVYGYQGDLLVEIIDRRWTDSKSPTVTHWFYQYDDRLRLRSIQSIFDDAASKIYKIDYDSLTGRTTTVNGYQFRYADNKITMQNERSAVETTLSPNMLIGQSKFTVKGKTICEQRIQYDSAGRMLSAAFTGNGEEGGGITYEYDADGRLVSAKFSHNGVDHTWNYGYNADGGLEKVNDVQLSYDPENGSLKQYGSLDYVTDGNGFVTQRGLEQFQYDSFGRLIRASRPGSYENRYVYDHQNRLITVHRSNKTSWHFYYAALDRPTLITHAYDIGKRVQTIFTYDQNDRLISMVTNGVSYLVITHPNRTPIQVFGDDGGLVKTVIRSPFGVVTMDTAPDFPVFIGYKGSYQDIESGLVIFGNGRPYDPNVGRFLSVDVERLLDVDPFNPESTVDPFVVDPRGVVGEVPSFHIGIIDWLRFSGYETPDIASWISQSDDLVSCGSNSLIHVSGECWLQKRISTFNTLLSVNQSPLLPQTPIDRRSLLSFESVPTVFGNGAVVANESNIVSVYSFDEMAKTTEPLIALLNHSFVLRLTHIHEGRTVNYFWKRDVNEAVTDWTKLGFGQDDWTSNWNGSLETVAGGSRKEIVLTSPTMEIRIRYSGETADLESGMIMKEILDRVADARWSMEKEALNSHKSRWSENERTELKETGRIRGYSPEYRMDPLAHPALLTDPNNVKLVKR